MTKTYSDKLKDPRWQKKRLLILERDAWTCQLCFDDKATLHVHHLWYGPGREPWEYPTQALLTLCEACHEYETSALPDASASLVQSLKVAGAISCDIQALADSFEPFDIRGGPPEAWQVVIFGLRQIIAAAHEQSPAYAALRDRWHSEIDRKLAEQEQQENPSQGHERDGRI